jgi:exonuclease III
MTVNLKIASMNVQGLGDRLKRKDVFNFLKTRNYNIYCIQDTHFIDKEEYLIRSQWGYDCFFSNFNSQSRGVAVLINNNFDFKLINMEKDTDGNLLIINCEIDTKLFTLICIYGPNRDDPGFYTNIKNKVCNINNSCIIVGDYNLVLNPDKDCFNYKNVNNPNARDVVYEIIIEKEYIDAWREKNMEKQQFTWFKKNPVKKARLDFFLISHDLFTELDEANILPGYRTDHSLIMISIDIGKFQRGKSYWKFNHSLLKDIEYVNQIKNVIKEIKQLYTAEVQNYDRPIEEISDKDIVLTINDQLFFETLMMQIRGKTISISCHRKKQEENKEQHLLNDIAKLENNNDLESTILEDKKSELLTLRKRKLEGSLIRSRAKWLLEGEKPSNYFCNLENRYYASKFMNSLYSDTGEVLKLRKRC